MASTTKAEGHRRDTSHREHGLFTPEPTPGPEQARLDADKERQLQESAQLSSIAEDGSQDSALFTQSKPEADVESTASTQAEDDQGERAAPTLAQIEAMDRVLTCRPRQYRKILDIGSRDLNSQADREKIVNSFRKQGCLTHPDYNLAPQAEKAFKMVLKAAQKLDVDPDEINEIKYWDGTELEELRLTSDGKWATAGDQIDGVEGSSAMHPSAAHQAIWKHATPLLGQLMHKPGDPQVVAQLNRLNDQIMEENRQNRFPEDKARLFTVDIDSFSAIFKTAAPYLARLQKSHGDQEAAKQFHLLNDQLTRFNKQHQYPGEWVMDMPKEEKKPWPRGTSTSPVSVSASGQPGYRHCTRKLDHVLDIGIHKKIEGAVKAGFGHQLLISHAGDNYLTRYELVAASQFGKGFGKSYLESPNSTMIVLSAAHGLKNKDLAEMVIAGVASVRRALDKEPANGWSTRAKTIVLVGFGEQPTHFAWYARSVLGQRFGQQVVDDEIDGYRSDAGQERPLGPTKHKHHVPVAGPGAFQKATATVDEKDLGVDNVVEELDEIKSLQRKLKVLEKEVARMRAHASRV
ncbi:Chaperone protein dnaJ [Lithohypha guttulata]|uniref:Chaperone protein dnaJ n=1 Tax=Lithohypha guttulata TaxID=1690604 RepID=UPI002DE0377F|nr:hypothetical protein LTR51_000002 [Lithohypha guttulata]